MSERSVVGWDVGGAHVKACLMTAGGGGRLRVEDVAQWPCALWQGLDRLRAALDAARERWPDLAAAHHAVTMTGEMVDLFSDRETGVRRIASELVRALAGDAPARVRFFAGDAGWLEPDAVAGDWSAVASANWLAAARHCALRHGNGMLVDIGSTTTDLVAFKDGHIASESRTDGERLASGELVYHGVVRTPLCALARRIPWRGVPHNVMNELFATTADVYRLTGELPAQQDQHPSADDAGKDLPATRRRLARMIGLDSRDGEDAEWVDFALAWRTEQVAEIAGQLRRVWSTQHLDERAVVVAAGCGGFLVRDVISQALPEAEGIQVAAYGAGLADLEHCDDDTLAWAQVCAPSIAVAALYDRDLF